MKHFKLLKMKDYEPLKCSIQSCELINTYNLCILFLIVVVLIAIFVILAKFTI